MHASDLGNPVKPLTLCLNWTYRLFKEFYRQGDKEKELGKSVLGQLGVQFGRSFLCFRLFFCLLFRSRGGKAAMSAGSLKQYENQWALAHCPLRQVPE